MIYSNNAFKYYKHGLMPVPTEGKMPVISKWNNYDQYDDDFIQDLVEKYPNHNIGVLLGHGIVAFDVDYEGEKQTEIYQIIRNLLPRILVEKIGKKGFTAFFSGNVRSCKKKIGSTLGFEVLSEGKQTVIPPSLHPDTQKPYLWSDKSILDFDLSELPELTQEIVDSIELAVNEFLTGKSVVGTRNAAIWGYAFQSAKDSIDYETWKNKVIEYDRKKHHSRSYFEDPKERGYKTPEAFADYMCKSWLRSIKTAYKKYYDIDFDFGVEIDLKMDLPETGFYKVETIPTKKEGEFKKKATPDFRFAAQYCAQRGDMTFNDSFSYFYKDKRWVPISKNGLNNFITRTSPEHWSPFHFEGFSKSIKALCDHDSRFWLSTEGLINLNNGILDVRTTELIPHSNQYFFKGVVPVNYDPEAMCPLFLKFLNEIFEDDQELVELIREMIGYIIMGGRPFLHKAFALYGGGRNGKSTLLSIMMALIGAENYSVVPMSSIDKPFSAVMLDGKLANIVGETPGDGINTEAFKSLVAGEPMIASFKGKDEFVINPIVRLIFACNNMPIFSEHTTAIRERLVMIPFNKIFKGEDVDVHLYEKLKEELPGILNFALHGVGRVMSLGKISEPQRSSELKDVFIEETDSVYAFYKECCFESSSQGFMPSFLFFKKYNDYCKASNRKPRKDCGFYKAFKKYVPERFYKETNKTSGYQNLSVSLPDESDYGLFMRRSEKQH